jgi:hypothetical protein
MALLGCLLWLSECGPEAGYYRYEPTLERERLSVARLYFEDAFDEDFKRFGIEDMHCSFGDQQVTTLFPIGRSDCRFLYFDCNGGHMLYFQSKHGERARTDWVAELEPIWNQIDPGSGTLRRLLWHWGLGAKRPFSRAVRSALEDVTAYAAYQFPPMYDDVKAWLVDQSGVEGKAGSYPANAQTYPNPPYTSPPFMPITEDEARALGWTR